MQLEPGANGGAGVFFDLEKTFSADAVEQVAATAMWRRGDLKHRDIGRVLWCYLRYNLGLIDGFEGLKQQGAVVFRGRDPEQDRATYAALFADRLLDRVHPEAAAIAAQAKAEGYFLAFISSTYHFMVAPFAEHFGFDAAFGCELAVEGGRCTGALTGRIYHQEEKAACVRRLAEQHGLDLTRSYAFGDSVNDAPMLEAVGHPVAVNPASGLARIAAERGWTVARWGAQRA